MKKYGCIGVAAALLAALTLTACRGTDSSSVASSELPSPSSSHVSSVAPSSLPSPSSEMPPVSSDVSSGGLISDIEGLVSGTVSGWSSAASRAESSK